MLIESGMQTAATYIGKSQGTGTQWVALRPIFEVCEQEQCFEGGGWRKEAPDELLIDTLTEASQEAQLRQRWQDTP